MKNSEAAAEENTVGITMAQNTLDCYVFNSTLAIAVRAAAPISTFVYKSYD